VEGAVEGAVAKAAGGEADGGGNEVGCGEVGGGDAGVGGRVAEVRGDTSVDGPSGLGLTWRPPVSLT